VLLVDLGDALDQPEELAGNLVHGHVPHVDDHAEPVHRPVELLALQPQQRAVPLLLPGGVCARARARVCVCVCVGGCAWVCVWMSGWV
jgi:hypothetical protein